MSEAGDSIENKYLHIRNAFQDNKLNWKEIDQLGQFMSITITNSWNSEWATVQSDLSSLVAKCKDLFVQVQYIRDIHARIFPEGYDSDKHFVYFLNGHQFSMIVNTAHNFLEISDKPLDKDEEKFSLIEETLVNFFQIVGEIGVNIPPYVLIAPIEKKTDPYHPLNTTIELEQLGKRIHRLSKRLPSKRLLELAKAATNGLNEFKKGKTLNENDFTAEDFWGRKKGIAEIQQLFNTLEKMFEYEEP